MKKRFMIFGMFALLCLTLFGCDFGGSKTTTTELTTTMTTTLPSFLNAEYKAFPYMLEFLNSRSYFNLVYYDSEQIVLLEEESAYLFFADGSTKQIQNPIHSSSSPFPVSTRIEYYDPVEHRLFYASLNSVYYVDFDTEESHNLDYSYRSQLFYGGFLNGSGSSYVYLYATSQLVTYAYYQLGASYSSAEGRRYLLYSNHGTVCDVIVLKDGVEEYRGQFSSVCKDFYGFDETSLTAQLYGPIPFQNGTEGRRYASLYQDGTIVEFAIPEIEKCIEVVHHDELIQFTYSSENGVGDTRFFRYGSFEELDLSAIPIGINQTVLAIRDRLIIGYDSIDTYARSLLVYDITTASVVQSLSQEAYCIDIKYHRLGTYFILYCGVLRFPLSGSMYDESGQLVVDDILSYQDIDDTFGYYMKRNIEGLIDVFLFDKTDHSSRKLDFIASTGVPLDEIPPISIMANYVFILADNNIEETSNRRLYDIYTNDGDYVGQYTKVSHKPYDMYIDDKGNYLFGTNYYW
jgi:hypothetical protein